MSLALAIFTDRQARLFRWLFGQPDRSFYLNELLRLTGLSSASLQQELKRLTEAGVVSSTRTGNLRLFQVNPASPLFPELLSLTRKTCGVPAMLAQCLAPLQGRLAHAWVYGSVAKQEDTSASDVDVLLVGNDLTLAEVLELLQPAEAALGRKVNPTCFSVAEFERRRSDPDSFVSRVLAQTTVPLFDGETHGD
jgi:predicted nucleotidyltransferase